MNYKQLLILRLSNLTEWKNENEMMIPKEMRKDFGWAHTCEFLDDGKYILRCYYKGGHLYYKTAYKNDQLHGFNLGWYENGKPAWKAEFQNGLEYGAGLGWWESGQQWWEVEYQNGWRHGLNLRWYENGHLRWKKEYQNGELVRTIL